MIIDHTHECYIRRWRWTGTDRYNGAYFYSIEIVKNIIPNVQTDRNWITVNIPEHNNVPQFGVVGASHSIVFVHNNLNPQNYEWLSRYDDLIMVCGVPETMEKVKHLGIPVYLPLSIDVEEVQKHIRPKSKDVAIAGRRSKVRQFVDADMLAGLCRDSLLDFMAEYRRIYAVGRTAIEAKALGCEILAYDPRYPDPSIWKVLDNKDAAKILQKKLVKIDK